MKAGIFAVTVIVILTGCAGSKTAVKVPSLPDISACMEYPEKDFLPVASSEAAAIRRFYDVYYQYKRPRRGRVEVLCVVSAEGVISECVTRRSTVDDREFETALCKKISRWQLPAQDEEDDGEHCYHFTYSFLFDN